MVLKEAYHYMNYLNNLINEAEGLLKTPGFITKVTEIHKKSKSNPDADDETIEVQPSIEYNFTPMELCDFVQKVIDEKTILFSKIIEAKKNTEIDIDSSISVNKAKQSFLEYLQSMLNIKPRQYTSTGTGYNFNNEGVQVPYNYEIQNTQNIEYDKNKVKEIIKNLRKETEDTSIKLDVIQATTEVDYIPIWDINDTLDDILGKD